MLTIDAFRVETMNQLVKAHRQQRNRAVWSPACLFHCFCDNGSDDMAQRYKVPQGSNNTLGNSLVQFMEGRRGPEDWLFMDTVVWPKNQPCSRDTEFIGEPLKCYHF